MPVFDDAFIANLRAQQERLPPYQRDLIYRVATSARLAWVRAEVEAWVAELAPATQTQVMPRLRTSDLFASTYHELAVGHLLRQRGYLLDYERHVPGGAPDWYAWREGHGPVFLVEVLTRESPTEDVRQQHAVADLVGRLQAIPLDVAIGIDTLHGQAELTPRRNKQVVREVRRWLEADQTDVGAHLALNDIRFEVVLRDRGYSMVQCIGPVEIFFVNPAPLRGVIEAKVSKYKAAGIPLVVAVVADPRTGYGLDSVMDVVLGQESVTLTVREPDSKIIGQRLGRSPDGLFSDEGRRALSAVVWVWRGDSEWQMQALHNPTAQHPLPPDALGPGSIGPEKP
ncbi:MAG: hypothetical protein IT340_03980 [Chloroflexi bacterium]|nr:hypothetical protein [Chloroflexota bacterium]